MSEDTPEIQALSWHLTEKEEPRGPKASRNYLASSSFQCPQTIPGYDQCFLDFCMPRPNGLDLFPKTVGATNSRGKFLPPPNRPHRELVCRVEFDMWRCMDRNKVDPYIKSI